jgi:4-amino-4-deoxy-L-arabinose transferase-like glycosyltransferase
VNRRHAVNAALLAWALLLFGWRLGGHDLWPPDEPRFGLVAKEMRASGDAIVLSRNARLYTDKPPLFFWAIDGASLLTGRVDETAARLPSLLGALGSLFLVLRLGTRLYDRRTGVVGAVVFATSVQILERARWASIDMTLCFFTLLAITLFFEAMEDGRGSGVPAAWAAMGLGTLAKGPVALVMPFLAVVPGFLLVRRGRDLKHLFRPLPILLYWSVRRAPGSGGGAAHRDPPDRGALRQRLERAAAGLVLPVALPDRVPAVDLLPARGAGRRFS